MSRSLVLTQDEIEFKDGDNILNTIFCASDGTMVISASDNGASTVVRGDLVVTGTLKDTTLDGSCTIDCDIDAGKITSGTFGSARIPDLGNLSGTLSASKIVGGDLDVDGNLTVTGGDVTMTNGNGDSFLFYDNYLECRVNTDQFSRLKFWFNSGTLGLRATIAQNYTNNWSDDRLKHNETFISDALSTLNQLQPISYYKTTEFYEYNKVFASDEIPSDAVYESGFNAQDVKQIPELTHLVSGEETDSEGNNTPLAVSYTNLHAFSVKAIQELHALVQTQQTTIADLTTRLAALESA